MYPAASAVVFFNLFTIQHTFIFCKVTFILLFHYSSNVLFIPPPQIHGLITTLVHVSFRLCCSVEYLRHHKAAVLDLSLHPVQPVPGRPEARIFTGHVGIVYCWIRCREDNTCWRSYGKIRTYKLNSIKSDLDYCNQLNLKTNNSNLN